METQSNNQSLLERLMGAGAHFGFTKSRRHPTVVPYIFGSKHGTDIIDLEQSAAQLEAAKHVLLEAGKNGQTVLFVGTKDEAARLVERAATEAEMPYTVNRWIGGMLTNFPEIRKRIDRLNNLQAETEAGELERKYTKKERVMLNREMEKLQFNFGGMRELEKRPDLVLVVDPRHDHIAVTEANDLSIPVMAIMSSDCDASRITHPIILNDALQSSVSLALRELAHSLTEGKSAFVPPTPPRANVRARNTAPTA